MGVVCGCAQGAWRRARAEAPGAQLQIRHVGRLDRFDHLFSAAPLVTSGDRPAPRGAEGETRGGGGGAPRGARDSAQADTSPAGRRAQVRSGRKCHCLIPARYTASALPRSPRCGCCCRSLSTCPGRGVVVLTIDRCRNILAADKNGMSDPYLNLKFGALEDGALPASPRVNMSASVRCMSWGAEFRVPVGRPADREGGPALARDQDHEEDARPGAPQLQWTAMALQLRMVCNCTSSLQQL